MSVEGRHQRQNVEKVKLDVMPSLEEMLTKKYINTLEQNVNQYLDENKYKEVKAAVVDAHDVKEEVDDELPSPCPSPGQSPKRISDENEFELKEEVDESFFEINPDPFDYPNDNKEERENKLDSESKVQERAAEEVKVESRPVQTFYCDLCEYKSRKIETVRKHMKKKHEGAVFVCGLCVLRFKTRYDLKRHFVIDHDLQHLLNI